jgi:hypothetical protein
MTEQLVVTPEEAAEDRAFAALAAMLEDAAARLPTLRDVRQEPDD